METPPRVGKSYKTKNGERADIKEYHPQNEVYRWSGNVGIGHYVYWDDGGRVFRDSEDKYDIIEEWPEGEVLERNLNSISELIPESALEESGRQVRNLFDQMNDGSISESIAWEMTKEAIRLAEHGVIPNS